VKVEGGPLERVFTNSSRNAAGHRETDLTAIRWSRVLDAFSGYDDGNEKADNYASIKNQSG
jgi:hypothetical protein